MVSGALRDFNFQKLLALPVGGLAQTHDAGQQRVVGTNLDGNDIGLAQILLIFRVDVICAGSLIHLGHGAVPVSYTHLPQMLVLFFLLSILEDVGYMSRVAFIMDRIFRKMSIRDRP